MTKTIDKLETWNSKIFFSNYYHLQSVRFELQFWATFSLPLRRRSYKFLPIGQDDDNGESSDVGSVDDDDDDDET